MKMTNDGIEEMRDAIAISCEDPVLVSSFIVIAEVTPEDGETAILTWYQGSTMWGRLGMVHWIVEKMRKEVEPFKEE